MNREVVVARGSSNHEVKIGQEAKKGTKRKKTEDDCPQGDASMKTNVTFSRYEVDAVAEKSLRSTMLSERLKRKFEHLCTGYNI